jgi:hypothetical protein
MKGQNHPGEISSCWVDHRLTYAGKEEESTEQQMMTTDSR